jgi:hypothetical protein
MIHHHHHHPCNQISSPNTEYSNLYHDRVPRSPGARARGSGSPPKHTKILPCLALQNGRPWSGMSGGRVKAPPTSLSSHDLLTKVSVPALHFQIKITDPTERVAPFHRHQQSRPDAAGIAPEALIATIYCMGLSSA